MAGASSASAAPVGPMARVWAGPCPGGPREDRRGGGAARGVEDGDGGGVLGFGGNDVSDVQVLGGLVLGGPEVELVGRRWGLLASADPAYGTGRALPEVRRPASL